jgi:uncharacterized membrane protein YwaF
MVLKINYYYLTLKIPKAKDILQEALPWFSYKTNIKHARTLIFVPLMGNTLLIHRLIL